MKPTKKGGALDGHITNMEGVFRTKVEQPEKVTSDHYLTYVDLGMKLPTAQINHTSNQKPIPTYNWSKDTEKWKSALQPHARTAHELKNLLDAITDKVIKAPPMERTCQTIAEAAQVLCDTLMCMAGWEQELCTTKQTRCGKPVEELATWSGIQKETANHKFKKMTSESWREAIKGDKVDLQRWLTSAGNHGIARYPTDDDKKAQ